MSSESDLNIFLTDGSRTGPKICAWALKSSIWSVGFSWFAYKVSIISIECPDWF